MNSKQKKITIVSSTDLTPVKADYADAIPVPNVNELLRLGLGLGLRLGLANTCSITHARTHAGTRVITPGTSLPKEMPMAQPCGKSLSMVTKREHQRLVPREDERRWNRVRVTRM